MKIKKVVSTVLLIAITILTSVGFTACNKQKQLEPIEFNESEAFRFGEYQIGMDIFMLYAFDIATGFVSTFGEDCWNKETIDIGWTEAEPQKAFILYATDVMLSAIACDIYYNSTIGELEESVDTLCKESAAQRYQLLMEAGMPEEVISEQSLYIYECANFRLSYVLSEMSETYGEDQDLIHAAILGLRNAIDENFDYERNINWELVQMVDYSVASEDSVSE